MGEIGTMMVVLGIDAHKKTHTVVAVDQSGIEIGSLTVPATNNGHLRLVQWATNYGQRRWAVEDCRALTRRLEADLLSAGEAIVRVPPKMMAQTRRSARTPGKSDPIDAAAVARAALREPHLPHAHLDGAERDLRLLVDHRETLIRERTRIENRLRWRFHELDPTFDPPPSSLHRYKMLDIINEFLSQHQGLIAEIATSETARIREITIEANNLKRDITTLVTKIAPTLLTITGCGALSAAKLVGEAANITRFRNRDAYAMWSGTAPIPVWSSNNERHRLNRGGNRQTNAAIHRIAITQSRCHPPAQQLIARRIANGDTKRDAIRVLKRRLADVIYRTLHTDTQTKQTPQPIAA